MNNRILRIAFCMLLVVSSSAFSQAFHANGYYWKLLPEQARISFVTGYFMGFYDGTLAAHGALGNYQTGQLTVEQLKDGVDYCYSDPKNVVLDVGGCIGVAIARAKNLPAAELEDALKKLRAEATKP
jgi:hypothetical protein